jgi:hypothetical protein
MTNRWGISLTSQQALHFRGRNHPREASRQRLDEAAIDQRLELTATHAETSSCFAERQHADAAPFNKRAHVLCNFRCRWRARPRRFDERVALVGISAKRERSLSTSCLYTFSAAAVASRAFHDRRLPPSVLIVSTRPLRGSLGRSASCSVRMKRHRSATGRLGAAVTQIEVIEEYGARLATEANELTHRLKPKESPSVTLFESAYLLIYLTLRPLREQWNLVGTEQTTLTLDTAKHGLLREVICAVIGVDSDHGEQTDCQRDEVNTLTSDHERDYQLRESRYDRIPSGEAPLKKFLEYIQTRIGRSFDSQEMLAQLIAYANALSSLNRDRFVNQLLELR